MSVPHPDTDHPTAKPVGRPIHRRTYYAKHIDHARHLAGRDPHRPLPGTTLRLDGTGIIVKVLDEPRIVAKPGRIGEYTWECRIAAATAFQAVCHQQIEIIEQSLQRTTQRRDQAA